MTGNLDRTSAKILVLGDSGVGKSSLIHLICHSSTLSSAQWTIGCSIDIKLYGDNYLEFWDIGGSRSHKIARRFLYQEYHGIILVFDSTNNKSRLNLNDWLLEVAQKTNDKDLDYYVNINVPAITIGTKKDMLPYQSLIQLENDLRTTTTNSVNSSVVDFNEPLLSGSTGTTTTIPHQQSRTTLNNSYLYRRVPAQSSTQPQVGSKFNLANQKSVIYINTQDVLSFNPGSKNEEKLYSFFKLVVERRKNGFYIGSI